jgi:hypothetical protein
VTKKLNGVFRAWTKVQAPDPRALPVIWGQCIVHFGNPEFSGRVLHTSSVLEIGHYKSIRIAETRNNYYALLGPELDLPEGEDDPAGFLERAQREAPVTDLYARAAMNANPACVHCKGAGVYRISERTLAICNACCPHNQGWWQLEGFYGSDNGRWACKAGCGEIVDVPGLTLEFLPRALR